jgi:hypothetical protein
LEIFILEMKFGILIRMTIITLKSALTLLLKVKMLVAQALYLILGSKLI